jgi:DNA-directed RNA polymerase
VVKSQSRQQIKLENEAWYEATKDYQELVMNIVEQKLAPNLPLREVLTSWLG